MKSTRTNLFSKIGIFCLVLISIQTSIMILLYRFSLKSSSKHFLIPTVIFFAELIKFLVTSCLLLLESKSVTNFFSKFKFEVITNYKETFKLFVPAFLYVVQNNLLFIALTYLDAATYQVTYQLKILTTALFSWLMLGRRLGFFHWLSLLLLMIGVSIVQVDQVIPVKEKTETNADSITQYTWIVGLACVLTSCLLSGFSGVYFERLLKVGVVNNSLHIKNLQLGIFSIILTTLNLFLIREDIKNNGIFYGYTYLTWIVIGMQAFGGLLVSVTVKYADNILKGFATSISIIINTLVSWMLIGDKSPTLIFVIGTFLVMLSTYMYGKASIASSYTVQLHSKKENESPIRVV